MITTFKTFIKESENVKSIDDIITLVKRDCKPWLDVVANLQHGKRMIFRGITVPVSQPIITRTVRTDRKPRDSEQWIHDALDEMFEDRFGFKYRSQGLFTSPSRGTAKGYTAKRGQMIDEGTVCMIFPKGNIDYCFSKTTKDVSWDIEASLMPDLIYTYIARKKENKEDYDPADMARDDILGMIRRNEFDYVQNADIEIAFKKGIEIMIRCKDYYAIPIDHRGTDPDVLNIADTVPVSVFETRLFK